MKVRRRELLARPFKASGLARSSTDMDARIDVVGEAEGGLEEHSHHDWKTQAGIGRTFTAPQTAPNPPDWADSTERVLQEMEDLRGIEDP
jgi:hypothetical protein